MDGYADAVKMAERMFSMTETKRRLRDLAKQARDRIGLPMNARIEIGRRVNPVWVDHMPSQQEAFPSHDDLADFLTLNQAARHEEVRREGAVVHLYFSVQSSWGFELDDVAVGWVGTHEQPPVLVHSGGTGWIG